jgi:hypothetical protein
LLGANHEVQKPLLSQGLPRAPRQPALGSGGNGDRARRRGGRARKPAPARGERHEIRNTGRVLLRTLNFYVPPAYRKDGEPLPRGRK